MKAGRARVRVLPCEETWHGVTYREDLPDVCAAIEQQIRDNAYKLMTPQALKAAQVAGRAVDVSADDFEG